MVNKITSNSAFAVLAILTGLSIVASLFLSIWLDFNLKLFLCFSVPCFVIFLLAFALTINHMDQSMKSGLPVSLLIDSSNLQLDAQSQSLQITPKPSPSGASPKPSPSGASPKPSPSGASPKPLPSGASPKPSPSGASPKPYHIRFGVKLPGFGETRTGS